MLAVIGALSVIVLLLTFASWHSGEHPLAIFAELYIDIVRGIPMIVLIVFIGLVLPGELGRLGLLFEPDNRFLRDLQRGTLAVGLSLRRVHGGDFSRRDSSGAERSAGRRRRR